METDKQAYNDKIKAIANADDILKAANKWVGEMVKHTRKDSIVEFARGNVRYKVANNGYIADVLVAIKKDGSAVLYELVNIVPTKKQSHRVTRGKNPHVGTIALSQKRLYHKTPKAVKENSPFEKVLKKQSSPTETQMATHFQKSNRSSFKILK